MDTKKLLIGGAIAAVAAYFFIFKKKNAEAEAEAPTMREAQTNTNKKFAESISSNVEVVEVDKATEEHNNAINEYKKLSGGYAPPSGLSTKQIEKLIDDMNEKDAALKAYVAIAGEDDIKDEDMTLAQVQNEIVRATNEKVNPVIAAIDAIDNPVTLNSTTKVKDAEALYNQLTDDLKKKITNFSKLQSALSTIAQLQALQAKKQAWSAQKAVIEKVINDYIYNLVNRGISPSTSKAFDVNTLKKMLDFSQRDKVYANQYFGTKNVKVGQHFRTLPKNFVVAKNITASLPSGTGMNRKNSEWAVKVRNAYRYITGSVNEYGEII